MGFFNKYPYTDFHELNADWLLQKMQELDKRLDEALTTLSAEIYAKVMSDIEPMFNDLKNQFYTLQNNFEGLEGQFERLSNDFASLSASVDSKLNIMKNYVDAQATACREYTNTAIEQNNNYIISELETYLSQIKVINFFTGEKVSVQNMFDYLASLHTTDSLDYDTMATRAKTYTELAAFNKTYTELVMSGNTWYI